MNGRGENMLIVGAALDENRSLKVEASLGPDASAAFETSPDFGTEAPNNGGVLNRAPDEASGLKPTVQAAAQKATVTVAAIEAILPATITLEFDRSLPAVVAT